LTLGNLKAKVFLNKDGIKRGLNLFGHRFRAGLYVIDPDHAHAYS
jgi:hypothetical protein